MRALYKPLGLNLKLLICFFLLIITLSSPSLFCKVIKKPTKYNIRKISSRADKASPWGHNLIKKKEDFLKIVIKEVWSNYDKNPECTLGNHAISLSLYLCLNSKNSIRKKDFSLNHRGKQTKIELATPIFRLKWKGVLMKPKMTNILSPLPCSIILKQIVKHRTISYNYDYVSRAMGSFNCLIVSLIIL